MEKKTEAVNAYLIKNSKGERERVTDRQRKRQTDKKDTHIEPTDRQTDRQRQKQRQREFCNTNLMCHAMSKEWQVVCLSSSRNCVHCLLTETVTKPAGQQSSGDPPHSRPVASSHVETTGQP